MNLRVIDEERRAPKAYQSRNGNLPHTCTCTHCTCTAHAHAPANAPSPVSLSTPPHTHCAGRADRAVWVAALGQVWNPGWRCV
eukprot:197887-Chlamydomonas_euryale.AAC.4